MATTRYEALANASNTTGRYANAIADYSINRNGG
jgi:hypothetical protein